MRRAWFARGSCLSPQVYSTLDHRGHRGKKERLRYNNLLGMSNEFKEAMTMKSIQWVIILFVGLLIVVCDSRGEADLTDKKERAILLAGKSELIKLSNTKELQNVFNRDEGKVRMILLVEPACGACVKGVISVRETLSKIKSDNIRIYVVWEPIFDQKKAGNIYENAKIKSHVISDSRVTQYWTDSTDIGKSFVSALSADKSGQKDPKLLQINEKKSREWKNGHGTPWDVYMLFSKTRKWGNSAPSPVNWSFPIYKEKNLYQIINHLL